MPRTIEISDETFEKLKDQLGVGEFKEINNYEDLVGQKIFFRGVTMYHLGKVKKIVGRFVHLTEASWIPDTGRFMQFIKDGVPNEVEPVGETFVNMDTVVDFFPWKHKLFTEQK